MVSTEDRIVVLKEQHRELEKKLEYAEKHLEGDQRITFIKKQKLRIKDELARLGE